MHFQTCMTKSVVDSLNYKIVVKIHPHIQQLNKHYPTYSLSCSVKVSEIKNLIEQKGSPS